MHLFDHRVGKGVSLTDIYFPTQKGLLGMSAVAAAISIAPMATKGLAKLAKKSKKLPQGVTTALNSAAEMTTIAATVMVNPGKAIQMAAAAAAAEDVPEVVDPSKAV